MNGLNTDGLRFNRGDVNIFGRGRPAITDNRVQTFVNFGRRPKHPVFEFFEKRHRAAFKH